MAAKYVALIALLVQSIYGQGYSGASSSAAAGSSSTVQVKETTQTASSGSYAAAGAGSAGYSNGLGLGRNNNAFAASNAFAGNYGASNALASGNAYAGNYGLGNAYAFPSCGNAYGIGNSLAGIGNLGGNAYLSSASGSSNFAVSSASPIAPSGISILSENNIEGPLAAYGQLPFLAGVGLEGKLATGGSADTQYVCGDGNVGILSENNAAGSLSGADVGLIGAGYANGLAGASYANGLAGPGWNNAGCVSGYPGAFIPNAGLGCGCAY